MLEVYVLHCICYDANINMYMYYNVYYYNYYCFLLLLRTFFTCCYYCWFVIVVVIIVIIVIVGEDECLLCCSNQTVNISNTCTPFLNPSTPLPNGRFCAGGFCDGQVQCITCTCTCNCINLHVV